jgi:hypothetical protein
MLPLAPPSPRASRRRSRRTLRRLSGSFLRRATPCEVAGGCISAAVAPPAVTEFRALREATHAGAGASIATSLAAAVATHPAASLGATSTALGAV